MSFQITQGLAEYDCTDHYAILGVAIGASARDIRKRYLKIARGLHPDSCPPGTDKNQASQVLSKLVNPAYEALSQDKTLTEYNVLLRLIGQRVVLEKDQRTFQGQAAQKLVEANDFETLYQETVNQLAQTQYESLEQVVEIANQLSELNLAYLLRREGGQVKPAVASQAPPSSRPHSPQSQAPQPRPSQVQPRPSQPPPQSPSAPSPAATPEPSAQPNAQFVKEYVRRAEELIAKNAFQDAIQMLRDGLKLDGKNISCHRLMGQVYLKQNKSGMAKHHFKQVLMANPQDKEAQKGMALLEKQAKLANSPKKQRKGAAKGSERRGLFGLFGDKKR